MRGLTKDERRILVMAADDAVNDDPMWERVVPSLVAAGRASVVPHPVFEEFASPTLLGELALRVCPPEDA